MDLSAATARLLRSLPRSTLTSAIGWLAEREVPLGWRKLVLGSLAHALEMDLGEAEYPIDDYASFQELFCRGLAPGLRGVGVNGHGAVSPVDGLLADGGAIGDALVFVVKGMRYSVQELLGGDPARAAEYVGGSYQVFYLSPRDYHRMHSPVDARVAEYRWIRGDFWPVAEKLVGRLPNVYCDNERVVTYLETSDGTVAMVKVAAFGVGYISLRYLGEAPGDRPAALRRAPHRVYPAGEGPVVSRGEEIASFGLGSTVVLLFPPGGAQLRAEALGRVVRVGMPVADARNGSVKS